jgi:hypothetical protein
MEVQTLPLSTLAPESASLTNNSLVYPQIPQDVIYLEKKEIVKVTCEVEVEQPMTCQEKWNYVGTLFLWFIVLVAIFWLIYFALKPSFVLESGSTQVDVAKVWLAALVTAALVLILILIIKALINRKRSSIKY